MTHKIALIQSPPVLLDLDGSIDRALKSIREAAEEGAELA
ncbi:MAG: carbon-nitrogen hydrolase family protein, partial [Anaerolineales bacterium]|nr:carbon-nitrogen hydrolase family protein [Anaerolineales bacterium]